MSVCDDTLLCNYPNCRAKLSGFAWVTACSHVFCDQHGSGEFSRSPAICPACSSALSGKLDIVRTELSPSEEYKAMVLAGLRPDMVLDISARALSFWSYQVEYPSVFWLNLKACCCIVFSLNVSRSIKSVCIRSTVFHELIRSWSRWRRSWPSRTRAENWSSLPWRGRSPL